ncbi:MAG: xanthine dehydrogenase family protein subunit M [Actinobacteria bacterium]|nr:xanthine dehydrogenase family protein subunit M [Actinomycetota bacterium]
MLRKIKDFEYFKPSTLSEAISLLAQHRGRAKILAGGTDLLIQMKQKNLTPEYLIDIKNISELDYIKHDEEESLKIGALVTHSSIVNSTIIQEKFDLLMEASLAVGSVQTRNKGTVVGNICNASPSADTPPVLIALDSRLKLISTIGERIVKIKDFFISPFKNILLENELVAEIQIPNLPVHNGGSYLWLPKITAVDETLVGVGVLIAVDDLIHKTCIMARIGLGSVAPTPIRAKMTEEFLKGKRVEDVIFRQAAEIAANEVSPRSRAEYRREMVKVLVKRALGKALGKIK